MSKNMTSDYSDNFTLEFNAISVGILVLDQNENIIKINDPLLEFFRNTRENFIGKRFGDAFQCKNSTLHKKGCGYDSECENCELKKAVRMILQAKEKIIKIEFQKSIGYDDIQNDYWFKVSIAGLNRGEAKNAVITFADITDRKKK